MTHDWPAHLTGHFVSTDRELPFHIAVRLFETKHIARHGAIDWPPQGPCPTPTGSEKSPNRPPLLIQLEEDITGHIGSSRAMLAP
jgi:hypothetical protein